jgi:hypothetical protein
VKNKRRNDNENNGGINGVAIIMKILMARK